jgi:hypothetical protein
MSEPDGAGSADDDSADDEELYNPISYEREPFGSELTRPDATASQPPVTRPQVTRPQDVPPLAVPSSPGSSNPGSSNRVPSDPASSANPAPPGAVARRGQGIWPDESWPPRLARQRRPPRWVYVAAVGVTVAAAAAGTASALSGGSPARPAARPALRPSASPLPSPLPPPITLAQARAVLAHHTAAANAANARMDPAALGGFETGSSQALDRSSYTMQRAEGAPSAPEVTPAQARFYIPREGPGYPHWFAVAVSNTAPGGGNHVLDTEYLVFTQSAPGAAWLDADEPYLLGNATAPRIDLDSDGYAAAISANPDGAVPGSAGSGGTGSGSAGSGLAIAPGRLPQATAESLDGSVRGRPSVSGPPNLADTGTEDWGRTQLPSGSAVAAVHTPADYPVLGLRTVGGGALLFYTDTATVSFTSAPGTTFRLSIAGFFDSKQPLSRASLVFTDQFATYDPPRGAGAPRVVADYSGIERRA